MEPLRWLFITMALTLLFIVVAVNPLQVAIDEAVASNARFQARRVASVINLVSTAPDGTTYLLDLPNTRCKLKITEALAELKITFLSGNEISETTGILKTAPVVSTQEWDCKQTPVLKLSKFAGTVTITSG